MPHHLRESSFNSTIANTIAQVQQSVRDGSNAADVNPVTHMFMVYVQDITDHSDVFAANGTPAFQLHRDVGGHFSTDNAQPHTMHVASAMMPSEAAPVDDEGSNNLHVEIDSMRSQVEKIVQ